MLSPGGTILSVSAVTDAAGHDDAFAITAGRNLWEHSPNNGWVQLSVGTFEQVSAGLNGSGQAVVFGVLTDNSLWENNPAFSGGWRMLSGSGTIRRASAGGGDEVFAITADHHLWDYQLGSMVAAVHGGLRVDQRHGGGVRAQRGLRGAGGFVGLGIRSVPPRRPVGRPDRLRRGRGRRASLTKGRWEFPRRRGLDRCNRRGIESLGGFFPWKIL